MTDSPAPAGRGPARGGARHARRHGGARGAIRDRASRGADLHAVRGGRARARDHVPVPVRGVLAQAARGRGTDQRQSSRRSPAGGGRSRTWRPRRCFTWRWCTTCSRRSAPPRTSARPNLPAPAHHYPAGVNLTLVPFGEPALRHFIFLERPEGMALKGAAGIDAPRARGGAADGRARHRPAAPGLRDGRTSLPLDRAGARASRREVRRAEPVRRAAASAGDSRQLPAGPSSSPSPTLRRRAAGDRHDPRAGGGRARPLGARRTSASSCRSWTSTARCSRRIPNFDPVRPVMFATVRRCEHDEAVPQIARAGDLPMLGDLFNVSYEILLQMMERYFAHTEETDAQLGTLADATVGLMLRVLKPLGNLITTLPVGAAHPGDDRRAELRAVLRERLPDAPPRSGVGVARGAGTRGGELLRAGAGDRVGGGGGRAGAGAGRPERRRRLAGGAFRGLGSRRAGSPRPPPSASRPTTVPRRRCRGGRRRWHAR